MIDLDTLLHRGVAEVIVEEELRQKLESGRVLRLKQGFDPSGADLHLGHAVGLRKLRQFQEAGHQVILIVGDWTAQVGDPSGRSESRPMLTREEVRANAEHYMEQFFRIVDPERTEVVWQSSWYEKFTLADVFQLTSRYTLARMMEHETFRLRWENNQPLTLMELMYPLLQGYDSVAIRADVEFGGTDQKFNCLVGRYLQEEFGQEPQDVVLVPLIPGTDGRKMSKTYNNYVGITEPPEEQYGKLMSIRDELLPLYYEIFTEVPMGEIERMSAQMASGEVNPRDLKMRLAYEIVAWLHGREAAERAQEEFVRVFQRRELPSEMPEVRISRPVPLLEFLVDRGLVKSKSEGKRLLAQNAVRIDGVVIGDPDHPVEPREQVIRVGKRRFLRVLPAR